MEDYKEKYELGSIVTAKRTYSEEIITGEFGGFYLLNKSNPKSIVGVVHTPNGSYDVKPDSIESVISDDEKIRKEILSYLKSSGAVTNPNWIAWLEKQGNSSIKWNKNTKDCKPKVNHSVLMKTTHGIAEGEWQGERWHQYRWAGIVRDTDVLSWIELSNLEKQGEHANFRNKIQIGDKVTRNEDGVLVNLSQLNRVAKPAEKRYEQKPAWSEEDERHRKRIVERLEDIRKSKEDNIDVASVILSEINWLKSLKERYTWKPSDERNPKMIQWTGDNLKEVVGFTGKSPMFDKWFKTWEEFEAYVHAHNDIFKLFDENGNHYELPVGAWIVKTPDGYNVASRATYIEKLSKKQGCFIVDKKTIDEVIKRFEYLNYWVCGGNDDIINKLKHLKHNICWKPSDEQMEVLHKYAEQNNYDGSALTSLYRDLKKLREK